MLLAMLACFLRSGSPVAALNSLFQDRSQGKEVGQVTAMKYQDIQVFTTFLDKRFGQYLDEIVSLNIINTIVHVKVALAFNGNSEADA